MNAKEILKPNIPFITCTQSDQAAIIPKKTAMMQTGYSIKDLEKLSGIKAHTIRIWEKRYNIISPQRTETNIRRYSNDDLKHILNISLLNKHGYKISEISELSMEDLSKLASSISLVNNDYSSLQEQLLASLVDMNEQLFNKTFMASVTRLGFEKTVAEVIFPFLQRIGLMWQTGTINPAQEHFFSNMARQKIIAATDAMSTTPDPSKETILLFLPENELHEMSLLFYNYAFKARQYPTIYLGASVPYESMERIYEICKPKIVITGMTNNGGKMDVLHFLSKLSAITKNQKIYCTGPLAIQAKESLPPNTYLATDLLRMLNVTNR